MPNLQGRGDGGDGSAASAVPKRRTFASALSALIGIVWAGVSALLLLVALLQGPPAARIVAAILFGISAMLALPWSVAWLRRKASFLRPTFVPPLAAWFAAAAGVMVIGTNVEPKAAVDRSERDAERQATAEEELAGHDERIATATAMLEERRYYEAEDVLTGLPRAVQQTAEVQALLTTARQQDASEEFISQMEGHYVTELEAIRVPGEQDDIALIWNATALFDNMARELEQAASRDMDERGRNAIAGYRQRLSARQTELFPQLRRAWAAKIRHTFWLQNITVEISGAQARTVTWTGATFAANANIDTAQRGFRTNLQRLRISRSQFRWYEYGDRTYYDLEPPADGAVGYWENSRFHSIE